MSELERIAEAAYIYLYPLVLMDETRRQQCSAFNTWFHSRKYPPGHFKLIIRPNFDTLYSIAWLDLTTGPVVIHTPDTNGRYYCMHMMDMWTDSFAVPGSRTWGTEANSCVVVGPHHPASATQQQQRHVIRSPTSYVWIITRIQTNGRADYAAVHKLQNGFQIVGLDGESKRTNVVPNIKREERKTPPFSKVKHMTPKDFFDKALQLLAFFPPHQTDSSIVFQLERLGMMSGQYDQFSYDALPSRVQNALTHGATNGVHKMRKYAKEMSARNVQNGWEMALEGIGVYGNNYFRRAAVAAGGLGAVPAEDAVYSSLVHALSSDHRYEMQIKESDLPPCDAFWSITLYDSQGYPVPNQWDKYALNNRHGLVFEQDGSIVLHFQQHSPGKEREKNWLPTPGGNGGRFTLTGRYYAPRRELLAGKWKPPEVVKVGCERGSSKM